VPDIELWRPEGDRLHPPQPAGSSPAVDDQGTSTRWWIDRSRSMSMDASRSIMMWTFPTETCQTVDSGLLDEARCFVRIGETGVAVIHA